VFNHKVFFDKKYLFLCCFIYYLKRFFDICLNNCVVVYVFLIVKSSFYDGVTDVCDLLTMYGYVCFNIEAIFQVLFCFKKQSLLEFHFKMIDLI